MPVRLNKALKELNVGIITVKRAYDDLCNEGLLVSIQGRGVFVASIDADKEKEVRRGQLRERLQELKSFCDTSDISKDELIEELDRLYRK